MHFDLVELFIVWVRHGSRGLAGFGRPLAKLEKMAKSRGKRKLKAQKVPPPPCPQKAPQDEKKALRKRNVSNFKNVISADF